MLILKRYLEQSIYIEHMGETLEVKIVNLGRDSVHLGCNGPQSFVIIREEAKNARQRSLKNGVS